MKKNILLLIFCFFTISCISTNKSTDSLLTSSSYNDEISNIDSKSAHNASNIVINTTNTENSNNNTNNISFTTNTVNNVSNTNVDIHTDVVKKGFWKTLLFFL